VSPRPPIAPFAKARAFVDARPNRAALVAGAVAVALVLSVTAAVGAMVHGAKERLEHPEETARAKASAQRLSQRTERRCQEAVDRAVGERDRALRHMTLSEERLRAAEHELELLRRRMRDPNTARTQ